VLRYDRRRRYDPNIRFHTGGFFSAFTSVSAALLGPLRIAGARKPASPSARQRAS
jgi:hypothetical protein